MHTPATNLALRSTFTPDGRVIVSLMAVPIVPPGEHEIVVRVEAAPINPSDLLVMLGIADLETLASRGSGHARVVTVQAQRHPVASAGELVPSGYEGAGTVVQAGADVQHLLGKRVSALAGGMFCRYRTMPAEGCIALPDDATAADGAALFVNPLTALAMIETMRLEGHHALVHTAAASNLGQMLNRICCADGIGLVNIVRSPANVELLKHQGAHHVVDSSSPNFQAELTQAIAVTGATIAFDAVGGGQLANDILHAMQAAPGLAPRKQVCIYGALDSSPTELDRAFGMHWSVQDFVMTEVLQRIGPAASAKLRERISREMKTTFASHYKATIGFAELLDPATLRAIARHATGQKYLVDPGRDGDG